MKTKHTYIWCTKTFKPKVNKKTGRETIAPFQQQRDVLLCEVKCPEKKQKKCIEYQEYLNTK